MKTVTQVCSLAELAAVAEKMAPDLRPGSIICLDGTLGAGKTHFVKALAAALGYAGTVSSPTFPLLHEYRWPGGLMIHMDFYRIENEEEIYAAGLDEYLPGAGMTVVEWAGRFPEVFPAGTWQIHLTVLDETGREVAIESPDY